MKVAHEKSDITFLQESQRKPLAYSEGMNLARREGFVKRR
jgi:hypothetical protein